MSSFEAYEVHVSKSVSRRDVVSVQQVSETKSNHSLWYWALWSILIEAWYSWPHTPVRWHVIGDEVNSLTSADSTSTRRSMPTHIVMLRYELIMCSLLTVSSLTRARSTTNQLRRSNAMLQTSLSRSMRFDKEETVKITHFCEVNTIRKERRGEEISS